jgi:hypothetical protein
MGNGFSTESLPDPPGCDLGKKSSGYQLRFAQIE